MRTDDEGLLNHSFKAAALTGVFSRSRNSGCPSDVLEILVSLLLFSYWQMCTKATTALYIVCGTRPTGCSMRLGRRTAPSGYGKMSQASSTDCGMRRRLVSKRMGICLFLYV